MRVVNAVALAATLLATAGGTSMAQDKSADATASVAVGPQYDTARVYVAPEDVDRLAVVSSQRSAVPGPNKLR